MENYPDWTKQQLMLLWFWNRLQEAYDDGDSSMRVTLVRGGDHVGVSAFVPTSKAERAVDPNTHSRMVSISKEIPELSRGGEAVAVFDRLWQEGYIDVNFGRRNPFGSFGDPVLHNLTTKGLVDIGKFPSPDKRLAAALEEVRRSIERDPFVSQKEQRLDALEKMISLVNNSREVGGAVIKALGDVGSNIS